MPFGLREQYVATMTTIPRVANAEGWTWIPPGSCSQRVAPSSGLLPITNIESRPRITAT